MADLTIKQGDTFKRTLRATQDGVDKDLTGATVTFHLRLKGVDEDAETVQLALTDPTHGKATLTIPSGVTATLDPEAIYTYEVEAVDGLNQVFTLAEGGVYVKPDRG